MPSDKSIYTNPYVGLFEDLFTSWTPSEDFWDDDGCEPFDPSLSFSGEMNGFYGKTHTEETKRLFSKQRTGKNNPMYGAKRCKECSNGGLYGEANGMYGKGHLIKGKTQNKRLTCPLCGMESNSTNIKVHIRKTHEENWQDVITGV